MRLLHITHSFPPESHGGTQQYLADLTRLQQRDGHHVAVVAGARDGAAGDMERREVSDDLTVLRLWRELPAESLSGDLGSTRISDRVSAAVRELAPDLVHVHHWQHLTSDIVQRCRALSVPVVLTLHDLFSTCARSFRMPDHRHLCAARTVEECATCLQPDLPAVPAGALPELLRRRQLNFANELAAASVVLTVSEAQRRLLVELGVEAPMRALPIGILPQAPWPAPPREPGRLRLAYWAGLDPRKGLHVLLQALRSSARRAQFRLDVHGRLGEAAYMRELHALAAGLDVTFHGPFEDGACWEFGGRHDLAVFPSLAFETHGLMVDEALHAGLPVLASDLGGPPDRLGGRGRTFPPGDHLALRDLLEHLLDRPDELAALRAAPHRASSLDEHHRALGAIYDECRRATARS